jgi:1-phosphofructokinase family hexose kinase
MINTLTLNPAIDKVITLDTLEKNHTNRVVEAVEGIGGKATHVSINLKILGTTSRAFGICHGDAGKRIMGYLSAYGLEVAFIHKDGAESRTNYLVVERSNDCTIIAEKGVPLRQQDIAELIDAMRARILVGDFLVLSGDAGNCENPFVYNQILQQLADRGLRVFVDTSGPALARCMESALFLVKPNLRELSALCGREVTAREDDVLRALDSLGGSPVEVVAVSMGGAGSILRCADGLFRAVAPAVKVRNTIGCGDCYLAGLVHGFSGGWPVEETLRLATAASAATAESVLSVGFDPARARELLADCDVRRLG